jgi:hypothetical protein
MSDTVTCAIHMVGAPTIEIPTTLPVAVALQDLHMGRKTLRQVCEHDELMVVGYRDGPVIEIESIDEYWHKKVAVKLSEITAVYIYRWLK